MGDESNDFHREVVRPKVTELLNPDPTDYILDVACGNGNYSAYLAEKAVSVVIDGFYEECYFNKEIPDIIIVRAIKIER